MPETQITTRFYPSLDSVISTEELPELLGFLKEAIERVFEDNHKRLVALTESNNEYRNVVIMKDSSFDIKPNMPFKY